MSLPQASRASTVNQGKAVPGLRVPTPKAWPKAHTPAGVRPDPSTARPTPEYPTRACHGPATRRYLPSACRLHTSSRAYVVREVLARTVTICADRDAADVVAGV